MLANYSQKQISYIIEGDDILSSKTYNKRQGLLLDKAACRAS